MAFEANEQTLVLALGCSGFCVVVCAGICCCRDFARRSRLRELAHSGPTQDIDAGRFNGLLLTGYQAPIRRLDPFASKKKQGNNVQANYAKVTSAVEDNIDHLVRAYGSLAAEIDPEDRLKLLSGGRRASGRSDLSKVARRLETESGEAPSRQDPGAPNGDRDRRDGRPANPVAATATAAAASEPSHSHCPPRLVASQASQDAAKRIPPNVLGKVDPALHGASNWSSLPDTLMRHIELPVSRHPPVDDSEEDEDSDSASETEQQRDAKFDALDAELTEHVNESAGFTLDPSSLHTSMKGLPKRKNLKSQKSTGKDRKLKSGTQGRKAPPRSTDDVTRV